MMEERPVDRGAIAVWRWTGVLASAFTLIVFTVVALPSPLPVALIVPALLLLLVILVAWTWWYPAAKYRHLNYSVDETGIIIRAGVFWRAQSALARVRIQHTDVAQGPLQRHYGVATLKLYTAGSHYTKIELPGLAHDAAVALRNDLQQEGSDHGLRDGHDDAI